MGLFAASDDTEPDPSLFNPIYLPSFIIRMLNRYKEKQHLSDLAVLLPQISSQCNSLNLALTPSRNQKVSLSIVISTSQD